MLGLGSTWSADVLKQKGLLWRLVCWGAKGVQRDHASLDNSSDSSSIVELLPKAWLPPESFLWWFPLGVSNSSQVLLFFICQPQTGTWIRLQALSVEGF